MYSLPLPPKKTEWELIQLIARNNNFPQNLMQKLNRQIQHKIDHAQTEDKTTWTTFTYYSPKRRKITNLFKHANIGIAFRNTTTLHQIAKSRTPNQTLENEKVEFTDLTCNTCHRPYIGQTSRSLKLRFQEHTHYIKHNESQSAYALHILNCRHEYGSTNDTMSLLKHINKPSLLLPFEQMYIQLFYHNNQLIPEQHPNEQNHMFQLLHNRYHTPHPT
jgi:hypothetical protein